MEKNKSFFITVEGCEGCGKSTQSELLKQYLQNKGFKVVLTREPGGNIVAERIRNILLDPGLEVSPVCELLLYEAARAQHVRDIIMPGLKKGYVVICDRFTDSTLAYQGYGRKIDVKTIKKLNDIATSGITPDLTVYLDINPSVGIKKAKNTSKDYFKNGDRIERESVKFHNEVRKGFLSIAKKDRRRVKIIKTSKIIKKTQTLINKEIDKFILKKKYV